MRLTVDIFEGKERTATVTHVFHGRSRADALAVAKAHAGTDSFFRGAIERGQWNGITLRVRLRWSRGR